MKYLFMMFAGLVVFGCADERSEVIADYVQTNGNVKTDMSFSLNDIEDLGDVYGRDSLAIVEPLFVAERERKIDFSSDLISSYERMSAQSRKMIDGYKTDKMWKRVYGADLNTKIAEEESRLADFQKTIKSETELLNKIKNDSIGWIEGREKMPLVKLYLQMRNYESNKDAVFARKAKATFSITNPMLNNAKQEVTKTFAFSPDNKKILSVIE